jgi:hypothetical protein
MLPRIEVIMPITQNTENRPITVETTQKRIVFIIPVNFDTRRGGVVDINDSTVAEINLTPRD